jgi:tryptophan synthase alpha chain
MNRISNTLERLRSSPTAWIVPYITPEFPLAGATVPLVEALEKAGAAMIEIGLPFSDPLADGPTIQQSSEIAIRNGANIPRVFEIVREIRTRSEIPLIVMGYFNPVFHYGVDRFLSDASSAGIDGVIIPDLPPEESDEIRTSCIANGISIIYLIAPTTSDERIRFIDGRSTDFSYCVSVTGVTGARSAFGGSLDDFLLRVKANASKPFVVGFGIKSREQIGQINRYTQGVVVGSALLDAIGSETEIEMIAHRGGEFISSLRQ